ncbi:uncharacterized protein [Arachis hypogaea]|uniref:uncharacterized protein n=1 Tax=Arachis hypogaea TaxID=3818 RepID=UPI003B21C71F
MDMHTFASMMNQFNIMQSQQARNNMSHLTDPLSPYYLHPGKSPGSPLIATALTSSNYHSWERAMWRALRSKNKVKFVDGSIAKPDENDLLYETWDRCNNIVVSWITLALSPEIAQSVIWHDVAADLWRDLKHRYSQGDIFKMAKLDDELRTIKQGELSVTKYFTKLKEIWEELENLPPIPPCVTCAATNCACGLEIVRKYKEDAYVVRFLKGLNEAYSHVKSQVMLMKPMPKIDQAFSMLLQQERQINQTEPVFDAKTLMSASSNTPQANRGRGHSRGAGRGRGRAPSKHCSYCGKTGHLVDVCYKKHGMPPHLKQGGTSFINNLAAEENPDTDSSAIGEESKAELEFTLEQKRTLLSLLQQSDAQQIQKMIGTTNQVVSLPSNQGIAFVMSLNVFSSNAWVIDSGATHHVSFSLDVFQSYYHVDPITVKLPDRTRTNTSIAGTIVFSESFFLNNVLFIPEFKFNLISVSKLTSSIHCEFVFNGVCCKIQDCSSRKMIGQDEQRRGLYAFENLTPTRSTNKQAINAELEALEKNNTWFLTTLPKGKRVIGCKWVFKTKLKADGSVERYKARLVAKGFTQVPGHDYFDTFRPVVKMNTLKILLAVAATRDWIVHQLDVNTAFLHGDLPEDVYMKVPPGLKVDDSTLVCKLTRSLYGLKQASRQWHTKLATILIGLGYHQSKHDDCLFTKDSSNSFTALLVYVDDLVLAGNCMVEIQAVKDHLHKLFQIKDIGELKYFLGIEFARNREGIAMYQRKYCLELLEDYGMLATKSATTPMDYSRQLSKSTGTRLKTNTEYRRLIGRLLYLANTRPEISYAVGKLSQFLECPTDKHFEAGLRVLRYLKSSLAQGLFFSTKSDLEVIGYSDSDWAACPDSRRLVTGYCFFLGTSLIAWKSKKQNVTRSSAEAEYRALAAATCEAQWIRFIMNDLKFPQIKPIAIYCDSQAALYIAANSVFHERTKYIEADCHIVRDKTKEQVIKLLPIKSAEQAADILTKALSPKLFDSCHHKFRLLNIHALDLREGVT